ncbi:MAG: glycosyl hydrolase family 88 [Ruminococcaceae bacterium]|nr:glycosyl hydrolase family 88 [Oscillospiraceae bacterium]
MDNIIMQNREWIDSTWEKLEKKLLRTAVSSRNMIPYTSQNGVYTDENRKVSWWTNGFWGGLMWLMYKETGNDEFRKTAEKSEEILDKALCDYLCLHHDVGFMWHITSGANYRITSNEKSKNRNLFAAASLFSRYNIDGEYIRAWNSEKAKNWSIIDCLMNIPLLYWASDVIGDDRFKKVAMKHADMSAKQHIREDGSVNHVVEHNPDRCEMIKSHTGQGYSPTSCWSRGLSWAVYGMVLSYIHTNKKDYLEAAVKTADYYIKKCEKYDYIPPIDFDMPGEPMYIDTTAGVITACGLIEIAKQTNDKKYLEAAIKTLRNIEEKYCDYTDTEDSILQMGSERYPFDENAMKGVHIPIIYGDFFFAEAILKLKGSDFLIW